MKLPISRSSNIRGYLIELEVIDCYQEDADLSCVSVAPQELASL